MWLKIADSGRRCRNDGSSGMSPAGSVAGVIFTSEVVADYRSDTIKVRMQLSRRARAPGVRHHSMPTCQIYHLTRHRANARASSGLAGISSSEKPHWVCIKGSEQSLQALCPRWQFVSHLTNGISRNWPIKQRALSAAKPPSLV